MYLAIVKGFEPLLLLSISFGMLLANLPLVGLMNPPVDGHIGGVHWYFYKGVELDIYLPLIFLGVGAITDFRPLIANPSSLLLGAAAQFGVFFPFICALLLGFFPKEAPSIGIIGGVLLGKLMYKVTKGKANPLIGSAGVSAVPMAARVSQIVG